MREEELSRDENTPASKTTTTITSTTTRSTVPPGLSSANEGGRDPSTGNASSDHSLPSGPDNDAAGAGSSAHGAATINNNDAGTSTNDAASDVDQTIGGNLTDEEKAKFKAQAEKQWYVGVM